MFKARIKEAAIAFSSVIVITLFVMGGITFITIASPWLNNAAMNV